MPTELRFLVESACLRDFQLRRKFFQSERIVNVFNYGE